MTFETLMMECIITSEEGKLIELPTILVNLEIMTIRLTKIV